MFRKGFTLIEMLVVIAIIGILAAMLAGPLMSARLTALKTACTNNLKQMGTSLMMYETNNNVAPTGSGALDSSQKTALPIAAMFKSSLLDNTKLVMCPVGNITLIADTETTSMIKSSDKTVATIPATGAYNAAAGVTTTYLFTYYYTRGAAGNRVIAGDAAQTDTSTFSPNHGDGNASGTNGANALSKDGSVKSTNNAGTGYTVEGAQRKSDATGNGPDIIWGTAGSVKDDGTGTRIGGYN